MITNIRIEDIGRTSSKFRIVFNQDGDERILSRTFAFKEDAQVVVDKLQTRQEEVLR